MYMTLILDHFKLYYTINFISRNYAKPPGSAKGLATRTSPSGIFSSKNSKSVISSQLPNPKPNSQPDPTPFFIFQHLFKKY